MGAYSHLSKNVRLQRAHEEIYEPSSPPSEQRIKVCTQKWDVTLEEITQWEEATTSPEAQEEEQARAESWHGY
ncbi:TPA: hypothetical protein I7730_15900 [Vibrio vulnificus]|uniref:Uncharacterized protein n=1 Tax=Vibrio vulnificus TaxID=672 RepID=A0A8H9N1T5_VIBVL|nr:hypothetical protein [Vibrio vulnificus]HAS8541266.1 hypothetical protein [Vibrio vulnificus]